MRKLSVFLQQNNTTWAKKSIHSHVCLIIIHIRVACSFSYERRVILVWLFVQNIKKSNPGLSFTDVGRALGDRWKKMSGMALVCVPSEAVLMFLSLILQSFPYVSIIFNKGLIFTILKHALIYIYVDTGVGMLYIIIRTQNKYLHLSCHYVNQHNFKLLMMKSQIVLSMIFALIPANFHKIAAVHLYILRNCNIIGTVYHLKFILDTYQDWILIL